MMQLIKHTARQFADAMLALLPPGDAWKWTESGFGDYLMMAFAQEPYRLESDLQMVMDRAIELHKPAQSNWHIDAYRAVALKALQDAGVVESIPRKPFTAGSKAGDRLFSANVNSTQFNVPLVQIDHLVGPFRAGSKAGDRLYSARSRFILRVRYYKTVVNPDIIFNALAAFKQAHVYLWFEDITGVGGEVFYAQN